MNSSNSSDFQNGPEMHTFSNDIRMESNMGMFVSLVLGWVFIAWIALGNGRTIYGHVTSNFS